MSSQIVTLPDGRKLGYATIGKGDPFVYFHGTASSRLEAHLLKHLTTTGKIRLIAIDRPGYGLSTYKPRKNLQEFNIGPLAKLLFFRSCRCRRLS